MKDYSREQEYQLPIKPSPNLPNTKSINLYPSLCLFEGTNVSAGRGTDLQFQIYGSPFLDKNKNEDIKLLIFDHQMGLIKETYNKLEINFDPKRDNKLIVSPKGRVFLIKTHWQKGNNNKDGYKSNLKSTMDALKVAIGVYDIILNNIPDGIETVSYTHLTLPTKRIV